MSTSIADFDYNLPEERIAQEPVAPRDSSKLMIVDRAQGFKSHRIFKEIAEELHEGDVLVLNNSKVFKARLRADVERTGTELEVFLLRPLSDKRWEVMIGNARRVNKGDLLNFGGLMATVLSKSDDGTARVRMSLSDEVVFAFADRHGEVPLPPYITKKLDDAKKYQTVYAEEVGSVAAPTAGFHFTPELLKQLKGQGVQIVEITLHVGLGTFQPVKTDNIEDHQMHSEHVTISAEVAAVIKKAKAEGRRVIAGGTTTTRALEGSGILEKDEFAGEVDLFIKPGYKFTVVDGLITNFHLPKSTLLVLVSAFAGRENILDAYQKAIENDYRFYSFGDAMFIR